MKKRESQGGKPREAIGSTARESFLEEPETFNIPPRLGTNYTNGNSANYVVRGILTRPGHQSQRQTARGTGRHNYRLFLEFMRQRRVSWAE
jgi:hypothetical protein